MQLAPEQLDAHLSKNLAPLYAVTGTEELRALEAADAIRARAKAEGFTDRKVYSAGAYFDWGQIKADLAGMSLFGDKPLIDLRIPTGKPGKEGGGAIDEIAALAKANAGGALLLVTFPGDYQTMKTAWVKALDAAGVLVESKPIEAAALPTWIGERLARQKQSASPETLRFIAAKVEGNLIAAHQEIMKLGLMHPPGKLPFEAVEEAVLNVARYDVFKLSDAWLSGDLPRFRHARRPQGRRRSAAADPVGDGRRYPRPRQTAARREGVERPALIDVRAQGEKRLQCPARCGAQACRRHRPPGQGPAPAGFVG